MAEQIDELFVKLGLEQDQESFQQAESSFDGLRSTALQFGAVIGGGLGLQELTFGFAESSEEARKLSEEFKGLDVGPQFVNQLRGAFRLINEDAGEAESLIRNLAGIIEGTDWGEISSAAFARGLDISGIQDAETAAEAMGELNKQLSQMDDPEQARRLGDALGLSSAQIRLLRDTDVGQGMSEAQEAAPLTQEMTEAAQQFSEGFNELALSMDGVSRSISETFVGDLGESMSDLAEYMKENREEIADFAESAMPYIKGIGVSLGVLVALQSARAALGIVKNVPGATAIAAGVGYGIYQSYESGEEEEQAPPEEQVRSQQSRMGRMNAMPEGLDISQQRAWMQGDLTREDLGLDRQPRDSMDLGLDRGPDTSAPQPPLQAAGDTYYLSVDASNASDPAATRQAVRQAVEQAMGDAAKATVRDMRSPVE